MQCRALAFRELPHQPPLHLAFVDDFPRVKPFFAHEPTLENAARLAATLHYPQSRRSAVTAILREQNQVLGAGPAVLQTIAPFEHGSAAFAAGQQAALFEKLFARIFAPHGLIIIDALDPRIHRIAEPIFRQAAEDRAELNGALLARDRELDRAGFAPQVKVTGRSTALFYLGSGGREAIRSNGSQFHADSVSWSTQELSTAISGSPESFSPNALLRPVMQDYLLPTIAYIGGPSEISYFAQSEVFYSKLLRRQPVFLPRAGFTLVDSKAQRLLEQYGMTVEDVWAGSQTVRKKLGAANLPAKLGAKLEKDASQIRKLLDGWDDPITKIDPSLKAPLAKAQRKISYQTEQLRQKAGWAQDKKTSVLAGHAEFLSNLLYPNTALQSSELNFPPLVARWGVRA